MEITIELINRSNLTKEEKRVVKSFWEIPLSQKHREWAQDLSETAFAKLFLSGMRKIHETRRNKGAEE